MDHHRRVLRMNTRERIDAGLPFATFSDTANPGVGGDLGHGGLGHALLGSGAPIIRLCDLAVEIVALKNSGAVSLVRVDEIGADIAHASDSARSELCYQESRPAPKWPAAIRFARFFPAGGA